MPHALVRGYADEQQRLQSLTATRASNRYCRATFLITSARRSRKCSVSVSKIAKQAAFVRQSFCFPGFLICRLIRKLPCGLRFPSGFAVYPAASPLAVFLGS